MSKTLTRSDLCEAVYREVGLSRNESADLVESILGHVSEALVDGYAPSNAEPAESQDVGEPIGALLLL